MKKVAFHSFYDWSNLHITIANIFKYRFIQRLCFLHTFHQIFWIYSFTCSYNRIYNLKSVFFLWIEGFVHEVGLKIHYFYICWIFCRWLKRLNILVAKWIYKLLFLNVSLLWKSLDYLEFTVCAFALIPSKKLNKINNSLYLGFCDQKKHWNNEWITIKSPHLNGMSRIQDIFQKSL